MLRESITDLIRITAIKDPFDCSKASKETKSFSYEGRTVSSYLKEFYTEVFEGFDVVASVNGSPVDPALTVPKSGSNVVFCLVPSDQQQVGRTLLTLAVVALSIYVPSVWFEVGTPAYGLTAAAFSMGGLAIVNALLPPVTETSSAESSPSYGWSEVNVINEGFAEPVIYGTVKVLPYLIGKYATNVWVEGYGTPDKQRLNLLFLLCGHSLDTINNPKINGTPSDSYEDVTIDKRYGSFDQTVIGNFRDTQEQQGVNRKIDSSDWVEIEIPGTDITAIGVGVSFPRGLGYWNDDGNVEAHNIHIEIQYSKQSPESWQPWINSYTLGAESTTLRWHRRTDTSHGIGYGGRQNPPYIGAALPAGEYKIRVRSNTTFLTDSRHVMDQYVDYVSGIVTDDFRYPGKSLLSVNAVATDQLSGLPAVSCVASRTTVQVHNGSAWVSKAANNPAWASYDMHVCYQNEYGASVPYSRMIYSDFEEWGNFCDANGYTCDIVFDETSNFVAALNKLSILGRGRVVQKGTKFGVVIDKSDSPVQLFGMADIVEGSFKHSYLSKEDRINAVSITYFDKNKDYERKSFELRSSNFETKDGEEINKVDLVLYGATDKPTALKHGKFIINCNEYLNESVEFEVNVSSLSSNYGDIIYVSHDVPQWGYSGKIISATSNTAILDRQVTLIPGNTYHLLVRHFADDNLEEVVIVTPGVETTTESLTLSGTWTRIPSRDDSYDFGKAEQLNKEFKIVNITRSFDQQRKITGLEYRSEVYVDNANIPSYEDETDLEPYVEGLTVVEIYRKEAGVMLSIASVTWRGFGLHYLFYKEDSANTWIYVNSYSGNNWAEIKNLEPGRTYIFAISTTMNPADGDTDTITFAGYSAPRVIWPVTGLQIDGQGNSGIWYGRNLKIVWNILTDSFPSVAEGEALGAGSFPQMTDFGGYRVKITDSNGKTRREFIQLQNSYEYTYDLNTEDGSPPEPNLIIQVVARDKYGRESEFPATITATNPAPSAPGGLTAIPNMKGVIFRWKKNTENDIGYYRFRTKVEDDDWSDWSRDFQGTETFRGLTQDEESEYGTEATIYFEVKAYDTFGSPSNVSSTNATTEGLNVQPTDINDFAITASKIFTKIPILEGDSWVDNSDDGTPGSQSGDVYYSAHNLYYNGVAYSIPAGSTPQKYIYWDGSSSAYSYSNTNPELSDGQFIIATNIDGYHDLAWNAIANQVIGSAYIEELAVLNAHIVSIDADKINATYLSSIVANLGEVTAGILKYPEELQTDYGFEIDLEAQTIIMGGTDVDADGSAAGVFLGWETDAYKLYIGDALTNYIKYDGSNLFLLFGNGSSVTVGQGGDIIMSGGATGNPSLIRFTDHTVAGELRFEKYNDNTKYWNLSKSQTGDSLSIAHTGLTLPQFVVGSSTSLCDWVIFNTTAFSFQDGAASYILRMHGTTQKIECHRDFVPGADSSYALGTSLLCWTEVRADDTSINTCSMRSVKSAISVEPLGFDFINALQPVQFIKKRREKIGFMRGFIIEDVEAALDEVGYTDKFGTIRTDVNLETGEVIKSMCYGDFISPIVKAMQEEGEKLRILEKRLERLETLQ